MSAHPQPILMTRDEVLNIERAAHHACTSTSTIRRWCAQHGISRQATPRSPLQVSVLGLEMVVQGDLDTLEILRAGNRAAPEVKRYIAHLGLRA